MIVTNDYKFSCNINEVIRSVLNFFLFFLQKDFTSTKKQKAAYREQKFKNAHKNILGKKSHLFTYLRFVLFLGCVFMLLVLLMLLVHAKSFCKKNKKFKRSQETSFCVIKTI